MRTLSGITNRSFDKEINILTAPTHERYQSGFSDIDATFHMIQYSNFKPWNNTYGQLPKNHVLWPKDYFPHGIRFDAILSQNKFGQFQFFADVARDMNIPIISLEHTLPVPQWDNNMRKQMLNMKGAVNVFISEFSKRAWGFEDVKSSIVVNHCVDSEKFSPSTKNRENKILCVVNDWKNRDWCCGYSIFKAIEQKIGKDKFTIVGDNPGLSQPASSLDELVNFYASHKIFLNTSLISPIPTSLLESMSCACASVSTATCMIPEIIQTGQNGFISSNIDELCDFISLLLENDDLANEVGEEARKTVVKDFNKKQFTNTWSKIIQKVCE